MTAGLGGLGDIDPDKVLQDAQRKAAKLSGMQEELSEIVGRAESPDGHVKAAFSATGGLTELELNPRVMRMPSVDLAEAIKSVVQQAAEDMQRQLTAHMSSAFEDTGDNPLEMASDPQKSDAKVQEIQDTLNGALNDVLGQVEQMRRKLGL